MVLPQEAICGFPRWRKLGRKILLKLLVHPLQGEDGADDDDDLEHGVVGPERSSFSVMVCKVGVVMMSSWWCHRGAGHDGSRDKHKEKQHKINQKI